MIKYVCFSNCLPILSVKAQMLGLTFTLDLEISLIKDDLSSIKWGQMTNHSGIGIHNLLCFNPV